MSQSRQQSSSIIFQQQEPNQNNTPPLISPHSATNFHTKQTLKITPIQVKTNLIKVKSNPRMKNKNRVKLLFDEQVYNQSSLKIIQIQQSYNQPQHYTEDHQDQCKSKTSSNQDTKPKTLEEQQIDNAIQQINMLEYPVQYYSRHKDKVKSQQKQEQSEIIIPPRIAKRQLDGSGDDQIKQKQQEQEQQQDYSQQQQVNYNHNHVKKTNNKPNKPPAIQIHFGFSKLWKFVHTYLKKGYQFQCTINCEAGFFGIGTKYHLRQKYQPKILLSAKKQLMSLNPRFLLSFNKQNHSRRHQDFVGIMQSNFSGTKWSLKCPILSKREDETAQDFQTILYAEYSSSVMGSNSIRDSNVYLLKPQLKKSQRMKLDLQHQIQSNRKKNITKLKTAKPTKIKGKYQLDFKGLAKVPSNKNFILTDQNGNYCLVFAKQNQQNYLMNIRYPLTLAQGFSLCLASLDNKLFVN